jgi:hypothetical protein
MRHTIIYTALILFLLAQAQALAATSPYSTPASSKPAKSSSTTTKPQKTTTKAAAKPVAAPPPPKDESFFSNISFGVAFISQNADVINSNGATSSTSSEKGSGIGIYADKFIDGKYRLSGALNYVSYDNFITTSLTASGDYLIPLNPSFAMFGGLAAGVAGQKYTDSSFSDMSAALVYGAQLGGILLISDKLMMELGYRLRMTNLETEIITAPGTKDTIEQMNEAYLSLIFSF